MINCQDLGLLHVAAAIHPEVKSERVFGAAHPFSWDEILEIMRKQNPERKFMENFCPSTEVSIHFAGRDRAESLLRDLGSEGFTSLEDTVWANTQPFRDGECSSPQV